MKKFFKCIDAGGEYCPCYLAETNDCITCSILQGKNFCDCNWNGTCIYQEYVWNGNKMKTPRKSIEVDIVEKVKISENCYQLKFKVTKTLARQLKQPGSYVFLRNLGTEQYFDLPMSIMDVDENSGYIWIAYQIVGSKTKRLDLAKDKILLRGPYYNGLIGQKSLKPLYQDHCLIVCKGIAQAPSALLVKYLLKKHCFVTILIDKGKVNKVFIKDIIKNDNVNIVEDSIMSDSGKYLIKSMLSDCKFKFVFLGGSDPLQHRIIDIIDELKVNPLLASTNNNEICCGEGVCGACSKRLKEGGTVKTCKTQLSVRENIRRRVIIE